jgi:hypothetical protein
LFAVLDAELRLDDSVSFDGVQLETELSHAVTTTMPARIIVAVIM